MITYGTVILISWAVFLLVWTVSAFGVKRDIRGGASIWHRYFLLRFVAMALVIFVALRVATGTAHYARVDAAIFNSGVFAPPPPLGWAGATLVALGILFAIWARVRLGANWSPAPAVKEKHELVTGGPYRWVRHPIYTGVALAAFGVALTGSVFGILIFAVVSILFYLRIDKEEEIMRELFPDAYPAYQAQTKKLIPFVF
jgi:protein-S-isoprenylcysteine O-methyltransferase Ste14